MELKFEDLRQGFTSRISSQKECPDSSALYFINTDILRIFSRVT